MYTNNQKWIEDGLWTIHKQKLLRGETQLRSGDLYRMFPELIGPEKVECGASWPPGWRILIYLLLEDIHRHNTLGDPATGTPLVVEQIKEKYGSLEFYWSGGYTGKIADRAFKYDWWPTRDALAAKISFAETYSEFICQITGSVDDIHITEGWIGLYTKDRLPAHKIAHSFTYGSDFLVPRIAARDRDHARELYTMHAEPYEAEDEDEDETPTADTAQPA